MFVSYLYASREDLNDFSKAYGLPIYIRTNFFWFSVVFWKVHFLKFQLQTAITRPFS